MNVLTTDLTETPFRMNSCVEKLYQLTTRLILTNYSLFL